MIILQRLTHIAILLITLCLWPMGHIAVASDDTSFIKFTKSSDADETIEQRIDKIMPLVDGNDYVTLSVENDLFGDGSDQNYTSGVRATWFKVGADMPNFIEELDAFIPTLDIDNKTSVFFSLGQNLYTPDRIDLEAPQDGQRPWAAWAYGSVGLLALTDNHIDEAEISLGIVGPYALGKQTQRYIHKLWKIQDPRGWKNQLKTEPGVILSWERRYPAAYSIETNNIWIDFMPSYGLSLGNVYTHAKTGLGFQIGPEFQRWQDMPVRVRPSMPGTGFFMPVTSKTRLGWSIFGGADARLVGRNIFLDGNTFRDSPDVSKKPLVYDLNIGAALTYGPTRLSYTLVRRSKEFDGQDDPSIFGGISLSFQF
jgi:lipid A 3-O-deacylase